MMDRNDPSVPTDWRLVNIGSSGICEIVGGGTPSTKVPEYWEGDIPWATPTDITALRSRYITSTAKQIAESGLRNSGANLLPPGSILMTSRATIGFCAINTRPMATNQGFANLICGPNVHNEFMLYLLHMLKSELERLANACTFGEVPKKDIRKIRIALPPLPEQRKIATIFSTVDDNIQRTQQIIDKTEELKHGLMQQLLTRGIGHTKFKRTESGEIPETWRAVPINNVCHVRRGASPRPIGDPKYFSEAGRGWVRIEDVTSTFKYLRSTSKCLSPEGVARSVSVNPGDLIMSICATIGKPVIVDMQACIHDGFVLFQNLSQEVNRDFFFYVLQSKEAAFGAQRQTGTQGNLNTTIVGNTVIPIPTLDEQEKIAKIFTVLDDRLVLERQHKADLERMKKGLMQVLLTGKVRVKVSQEAQ